MITIYTTHFNTKNIKIRPKFFYGFYKSVYPKSVLCTPFSHLLVLLVFISPDLIPSEFMKYSLKF